MVEHSWGTFIQTGEPLLSCVYKKIDEQFFNSFCAKYHLPNHEKKININIYHLIFWLYNQFNTGKVQFNGFHENNGFEIFEKCNQEYSPNCACFAIMLNDILISLGIKSKVVWCLSQNQMDKECHALNHVFNHNENNWFVADPSCQSVVCNQDGNPIDLLTLRETIMYDGKVYPHRRKNTCHPEQFITQYNLYMKKNLFQFIVHTEQGLSYPPKKNAMLIHPIGYVPNHELANLYTCDVRYIYN